MNLVEKITIDREAMILALTGSMFDAMTQDDYYMDQIIEHGFKGFKNYTDDELVLEYREYISNDASYPVIIELKDSLAKGC